VKRRKKTTQVLRDRFESKKGKGIRNQTGMRSVQTKVFIPALQSEGTENTFHMYERGRNREINGEQSPVTLKDISMQLSRQLYSLFL